MLSKRLDLLSVKFLPEEHKILHELRLHSVDEGVALVAVSGGVDSILLLAIMRRLAPVLKMQLHAVHIHHGGGSRLQLQYRNRAQKFVAHFCKKIKVPFWTNRVSAKKILKTEAELRNFRYQEIEKFRQRFLKKGCVPVYVFLAHHQDDLVETQMMRLIRGTGPQGLEAMSIYSADTKRVRPLLPFSRVEIERVAANLGLRGLDDPSNQSLDPLRNWMRQSWFKSLERKRPGAKACLARSFQQITQALYPEAKISEWIFADGMDRQGYMALSRSRKLELIAEYLRSLKIRNFSAGQIAEISKRLDNRRVRFTFRLLQHDWSVNEKRICAILSAAKLRKVKK